MSALERATSRPWLVAILALMAGSASCQGGSSSGHGGSDATDAGSGTDDGGDDCPYLEVTCTRDPSFQCPAEMVAFECAGGEGDPSELDSVLVCGAAVNSVACGTDEYCCADTALVDGGTQPTCVADSAIACPAGAVGFACVGGAGPATATNCTGPTADPSTGTDFYCCPQ